MLEINEYPDVHELESADSITVTETPEDEAETSETDSEVEILKEIVGKPADSLVALKPDSTAVGAVVPEEVAGVLTKDGKHVIPFEVLKRTRDSESQYRRTSEEALARVRELEARLLNIRPAQQQDTVASDEILGKLDTLSQDFPDLGDAFKSLHGTIASLSSQIEGINAERSRDAENRTIAEASIIRGVIDNNTYLSLWEAQDQRAWDRAIQFDNFLKVQPEWVGKPYAERFAKAVDLVVADYPEAKRPQEVEQSKSIPSREVKSRAIKAVEEAGDFQPTSLSDIPGGVPPSEKDIRNLSSVQLEALFEKMDDDQIMAFLAKRG